MKFVYSDGGREEAGFKGRTGDCGVRAVAIASQRPYKEVYKELTEVCSREKPSKQRRGTSHPRTGIHVHTMKEYLASQGWEWVATMGIGTGCKVHLRADELPAGPLVVRVSRHFVAVVDGVAFDNHNPVRGGRRCVYGYWRKVG